jgi:hypothetical protein
MRRLVALSVCFGSMFALFGAIFVQGAFAQSYPTTPQQPAAPQPAQQPAQPMQPAQQPGQVTTGEFPSVSNLKPFTPEASFMSLAGYLRYLMHQQTSQWLTYQEAARIVRQQAQ